MSYKNKTVWITGASSGIGEALTLNLAEQGAHLIISSRRSESLEKLAERCEKAASILIVPLDLEDEQSVQNAADEVLEKIKELHYVFHNGGISQRSLTHETSLDIDHKLMQVNYFGAISLTKRILPVFLNQGFGHFVVTSTISGVFGFPLRSAYSASKHALHGYFDSLRAEHVKNNIDVTIVCPGRIKTNISLNAIGADGKATGVMDDAQNNGMSADLCAKKMLKAVEKKKKEIYIGGKEILMVYFKRFIPSLYYKLAATVKPD
ncbi:MAG: SDR family oxidoreductase [Schleiferiaceae bacterium]|nr:SDR family oxidoreductase [Schleiferiaceae bacterium]